MLWPIKQVLLALLSFIGSLETKYVSLHNEPCITIPTLINTNPVFN